MVIVGKWSKPMDCGSIDRGFESHLSPQNFNMKKTIQEKLELVEEAISDWRKGKLQNLSAIVAISMIINNNTPSEEFIQWAMETLSKVDIAKKIIEKEKGENI